MRKMAVLFHVAAHPFCALQEKYQAWRTQRKQDLLIRIVERRANGWGDPKKLVRLLASNPGLKTKNVSLKAARFGDYGTLSLLFEGGVSASVFNNVFLNNLRRRGLMATVGLIEGMQAQQGGAPLQEAQHPHDRRGLVLVPRRATC